MNLVPVLARLAMAGWLLTVWLLLWGEVTVVIVVGGVAAVAVTYWATRLPAVPALIVVRPHRAIVPIAEFAADLVASSLVIARHALWRPRTVGGAIIAVSARSDSDLTLMLVFTSLSLRPGTLVLDIDRHRSVFYVHAIPVRERSEADDVRRGALNTEKRLVRAFGSPRDLDALRREPRER